MTTVWEPARLKAAQQVKPMGGVIRTPATVTWRSARGRLTLNTPSPASSFPLAPVSCSILATFTEVVAATTAEPQAAILRQRRNRPRMCIARSLASILPGSERSSESDLGPRPRARADGAGAADRGRAPAHGGEPVPVAGGLGGKTASIV